MLYTMFVLGLAVACAYQPACLAPHTTPSLATSRPAIVMQQEARSKRFIKTRKDTPAVDPSAVEEISSFVEEEEKPSTTQSKKVDPLDKVVDSVAGAVKAGRKLSEEYKLDAKAASAVESVKKFNDEHEPMSKAKAAFESAKKFDEENEVLLTARAVFELGFDSLNTMMKSAKPAKKVATTATAEESKVTGTADVDNIKKKRGFKLF